MEDQQVAVVTGAGSGLGEQCARKLVERGWAVHGWDISPSPVPGVEWTVVDVGDPQSVVRAASSLGDVSLLINSAGIGGGGALARDVESSRWSQVLDVNLGGALFCYQACYSALRQSRGVVVNIASICAHVAGPNRVAYCVSKAGVVMLTKVLAIESAGDGIRVLSVSPGYMETPMVTSSLSDGRLSRSSIESRTPQGRLATPDEVAAAILSIATGTEFSYTTGSDILVDGGWAANGAY